MNGVPKAFEADGQTARMGKDGMTPLSLAEWIDLQSGNLLAIHSESVVGQSAATRLTGSTDGTVYTTYLFGPAAFAKGAAPRPGLT